MIHKIIQKLIDWWEVSESKSLKKELIFCGKSVVLDKRVKIAFPDKCVIEEFVYIGPDAVIHALGGVKIKRGAVIGPRLKVHSVNHTFRNATSIPYDETFDRREVVIGENVWLGSDVILLPGARIGEGCIIGAGSVVSGEVPPMSIAVGNPVKVIKQRDTEHYAKLKAEDRIYMKLKLSKEIKQVFD
ncbi:acyltransferase [Siphonobacter aquaeclarae]|uniref:Hexapeptide repeat of succinyl-transferase n=1 Tax=Siphonobacter aquaeclarae TaxID=563176 RepID=A0A1G9V6P1_9BACT|nr:acyltransferase [Siphonobacter aquaeclarae]SDM67824.1 Hexapeptide repeat of succinyl-transferase [Siphonobacter aquaeclarae]